MQITGGSAANQLVTQEMPKPGTAPHFSTKTVKLEQRDPVVNPNRFDLVEGFTYTDSGRNSHEVRKDVLNELGSDLASVPSMLWWYVGPYGRQTRAALIHDYLVRTSFDRAKADWVFRDALRASEVPMLRRGLMWTAVSLETTFLEHFSGRIRSRLLQAVHLAAFIAACYYWAAGGEVRSWRALLAGALLGSFLASCKKPGAALLIDHVTLIVLTLCFWLLGEWSFWLFAGAAASWLVWGRRSLWMLFGIVTLLPAGALVWIVRGVIGLLEKVVAPVAYLVKLGGWKVGGGEGKEKPKPVRERPRNVLEPTIQRPPDDS